MAEAKQVSVSGQEILKMLLSVFPVLQPSSTYCGKANDGPALPRVFRAVTQATSKGTEVSEEQEEGQPSHTREMRCSGGTPAPHNGPWLIWAEVITSWDLTR